MPRTDVIDISSNETSPIQNHSTNPTQPLHSKNITLDTTLALSIPLTTTNQTTLTQEIMVSPLVLKALVCSTYLSPPLKTHPYLTFMNDLPPRSFNPPPPSPTQDISQTPQTLSQGLSQTLPQPKLIDFKPSLSPIKLSRSRLSAQLEPLMTREQIQEELNQFQNVSQNVQEAIQTAEHVQYSLIPPTSITSLQIPPPFYYTTTTSTTIPPFKTSLPPSNTFIPLDQSVTTIKNPSQQ
ncbi:hypothetical protein Tco_1306063, partial [Tanacetum coccineum]